jgi:hypothetical protein
MYQFILPAISAANKLVTGIRQGIKANKVVVPNVEYKPSQFALNTLATAKQLNNARMPGATVAEQNIMGNMANANAGVSRNSTDGSQSLAMLSATQGQADTSIRDLGQQEAAFKMQAIQNLNQANQGMTDEEVRVYQDKLRMRNEAIAEKSSLRQSGMTNRASGLDEAGKLGFMFKKAKDMESMTLSEKIAYLNATKENN